jgi:replication factor A1
MNVEQIFSQLRGKIAEEEFQQKIQEKIDEFGGLLSEEGAALIVATDLGVDLRQEKHHEFLEIIDLSAGMSDIWLCARVTCVSSIKMFQRGPGIGKVANIDVMDKTGSTRIVLWDDLADRTVNLNKGDVIEIRRGYVMKGFREGVEIHLSPSRRGIVCKMAEPLEDLPECKTEYTPIGELEEEMADVDVVGRVGQLYGIREFQKNGGTGKVASLSLVDDTGEIRLYLWSDKADIALELKQGDIIAVEGGYTKIGLSDLELHSGWRGRIILNPDVDIRRLPQLEKVDIVDLKPDHSYNVSGIVSEIGKKRSFVRSDGSPGQVASFNLRDKMAEIRVVLWNEKADIIDTLVQGIPILLNNGFAKEGIQGLELHISSMSQVIIEARQWLPSEPPSIMEDEVRVIDGFAVGLRNENAKIWLYYLTDELFVDENSVYSNIDYRLYRFEITRQDVNVVILMKNKYPIQCEKIQSALGIDKIPCLIISARSIGIPQEATSEITLPKNYGILKRGFFAEELCKNTDKLDSLLYDIYEGVRKGKSVPEVFGNLKIRHYLGKTYKEARKWISF